MKLKKNRHGVLEQVTPRRIRATTAIRDVAVRVWPSGRVSGKILFVKLDEKRRYLGKVSLPFTGTLQERPS